MTRKKVSRIIVASLVGLASDCYPIPGYLLAALIFPEGAESTYAVAWLVLALLVNFALFFAITYYVAGFFAKPRNSN